MKQVYENVPESDVPQVEEDCRSAGATEVLKEPQGEGLYNVTCIYPDKKKPATSE